MIPCGRGHRGRSSKQNVGGRWFRWNPKFTSNNLGRRADASCTRAPSVPWGGSRRAGHHRASGLLSRLWLSEANREDALGTRKLVLKPDLMTVVKTVRPSVTPSAVLGPQWSHRTQQGTQQMSSLCLGRHRSRDRTLWVFPASLMSSNCGTGTEEHLLCQDPDVGRGWVKGSVQLEQRGQVEEGRPGGEVCRSQARSLEEDLGT